MTEPALHPRDILFDADEPLPPALPVCDHYAGVEVRMRKSLALQAELGPVFDITLDLEDGAPVGGEREHAALIAELLGSADNRHGRVGVRLPQGDHPAFADCARAVLAATRAPAYLMCPKLRSAADFDDLACRLDALGASAVPLHGLVETHGALRDVAALAAHPRIESLSFGLMDFVSAHRGAIPRSAMSAEGQFEHPLVVRAKVEIAAACHAAAKVPSHCVVTEFRDTAALADAARRAMLHLGYLRMWSIHPAQVRVIVDSFAPTVAEVDEAAEIVVAAAAAGWAPIAHRSGGHDTLHDRASYRYFWQVLERAARTSIAGVPALPGELRARWFAPTVPTAPAVRR
ncbi:MAG: HpcH/HpaI aldolase/citrate lyase family protein [Rubrivivax sp.]|jgi:citrate lyase subunit beta/citryl-CoA lyase|nr:aldolase/citrate lyase family protein [Rubrivivax sp.]